MFAQRTLPITEDIMLKWRLVLEEGAKPATPLAAGSAPRGDGAAHHDLTVVTRDTAVYARARCPVVQPVDRHCAERE